MTEPREERSGGMTEPELQHTELNDEQLMQQLKEYLQGIPKEGTKVIVLIGGPASGKGVLASNLAQTLGNTAVLSTDNYLKGDRAWRRVNIENKGLDPILKYDPVFLSEQVRAIKDLEDGQEIRIPVYDGASGVAISADPDHIPDNSTYPTKVTGHQDFVIVEGDFQFLDPQMIDRLLFLDVDNDTRLANRIHRDTVERGQPDAEGIIRNFKYRQETQFLPHTLPEKDNANLIIKVNATPLETPTPNTRFSYQYRLVHARG